VLSPLFFLIYSNALPGTISQISSPTLFADDANIICVHHNPNTFKEKIEEILKISKWFQANSLTINLNKTKFIQFSTKINLGTSICIEYEQNHIENSQSTSFLDLTLNRTLSWQLHINKLCTKFKSACYILEL
jgi:hypothetical protein